MLPGFLSPLAGMQVDPMLPLLQGNLKWFAGREEVAPLFDELELATDLHTQLEHLSFQHVFGAWSLLTTCSVQQSHLHSLRTLPVSTSATCYLDRSSLQFRMTRVFISSGQL